MTPWMRKIHKWIGLLIGIQLVLWMSSGVVMSLLDADKVRGGEFRVAKKASARLWPLDTLPAETVLAAAPLTVHTLSTGWLLDRPVYKLTSDKGIRMIDARQGHEVESQILRRSVLGRILASGGDPVAGVDVAREGVRLAEGTDFVSLLAPALIDLAECLRLAGEGGEGEARPRSASGRAAP